VKSSKIARTLWSFTGRGAVWDVAMPRDGSFVAAGYGITSGETREDLIGELVVLSPGGRPLWRRPSKSGVHVVDVPSDGSSVLAIVDGAVQKYSKDGRLLWKHTMAPNVICLATDATGSHVAAASRLRLDGLGTLGETLWSTGVDGSIWDLHVPRLGAPTLVSSWGWPGGKHEMKAWGAIAAFGEKGTQLWRHPVTIPAVCRDDVYLPLAASHDASAIALGSPALEGRVLVFNREGLLLWSDHTRGRVVGAAMAGDGSVIALGEGNFELDVLDRLRSKSWTRGTGGDPRTRETGDFGIAVAPDGSLIAAGSGDENLYLFDRDGNLVLKEPVGVKLLSATFSEDGSVLVAGSWDGTVKALRLM
jgi:outer membrane protein assembly factor BamB